MRVERPEDRELGDLVTRFGPPVVHKEEHSPRELTDRGHGPSTKGAALVAAFDESGRLAIVRKRGDDRWYLPSGRVLPHETVEEGAVREAREEAGIDVELVSMPLLLIIRYQLPDGTLERWCPVFTAKAKGTSIGTRDPEEIEEVEWVRDPPGWWRGTWREKIVEWGHDPAEEDED
jgi:8-oxo-dGTP pyrophosphatase MutT (NUDIX family)